MRLAILASHPIQYQAPIFRELARRMDVTVYFAHQASPTDQASAGFGVGFEWDIDLLTGYQHSFLKNVAARPGLDHFAGCDTPTIAKQLANASFDAVLVMGWHLKTFWQGIWAAKRAGIPVMVRGDSQLATPRSKLKKMGKAVVYPIALRVFDAALYVGERSRLYWANYGYPAERLVFSPHCVDNDWFAERATREAGLALRAQYGIAPEAKVVLFAGKLLPFKRPLDLIAAANAMSASIPGLTVLVAGSGELSDSMSSMAQEGDVKLVQMGFCNQTKMPAAFAAADVLVLPSEHETWGLVANEALACGCPVIVSDACGCTPDLLGDGTVGRVFPVGDVQALSAAITEVVSRPPGLAAIVKKASVYSIGAAVVGISHAVELVSARRGLVA
jgi:glycosyltransferase involved in cell wall biosynthesis